MLQLNFDSCIVSNGHISDWFPVTRSTHQGDPLAAYLFLICGEVMSHVIKQNPAIEPLEILGVKDLISQFADDTQLFEKAVKNSLKATVESMELVRQHVGLDINYEKKMYLLL